jgi:hypothetical protein
MFDQPTNETRMSCVPALAETQLVVPLAVMQLTSFGRPPANCITDDILLVTVAL